MSPPAKRLPSRGSAAALGALARAESGNAAVEMALIAVPFLLFVFGIIALGQMMWLQNALDASVAAAARCASINTTVCGTISGIQSYAAAQAGAGFTASVFSADTGAACGNQVTASYPLALIIPFMNLSVTLTSEACFPDMPP